MKTPDEIKKGLGIAVNGCMTCDCCITDCPYDLECSPMNEDTNVDMPKQMAEDALAYIQQLENHIGEFTEKVMRLEKERNALLADLRDADMLECDHCAHYIPVGAQCKGEGDCLECDYKNCACNGCWGNSNWKWRGVQEVEHVREF